MEEVSRVTINNTLPASRQGSAHSSRQGWADNFALTLTRRLRRLLDLRARHVDGLNARGVRLLDQAIYSTYCDLRTAGCEKQAQRLLRGDLEVP